MFRQINDITTPAVADFLIQIASYDRNWVEWEALEYPTYRAKCKYRTVLDKIITSGSDYFSLWGLSIWLLDGPKIFRPTIEQCEAMEQIEVRLAPSDYSQPYQALLVDLPDRYAPFESVLCFQAEKVLVFTLTSKDHLNDITTTVSYQSDSLEEAINKFDPQSLDPEESRLAARALRVACNACLALSNYGAVHEHLYLKVVQNDRKLAQEKSERGARAKKRLETAPSLIKFAREVVLHRTTIRVTNHGNGSVGCEKASHWRRGHWAMQAYGEGRTLRKRILRPPVLVRSDKFLGDLADTTTTYKG